MAINEPPVPAGTHVACIPLADFQALHALIGQVFGYAAELNLETRNDVPRNLTGPLRSLALAACNRFKSMPTSLITMPADPPAPVQVGAEDLADDPEAMRSAVAALVDALCVPEPPVPPEVVATLKQGLRAVVHLGRMALLIPNQPENPQ